MLRTVDIHFGKNEIQMYISFHFYTSQHIINSDQRYALISSNHTQHEHPHTLNGGYVKRSRLVMEEHLGRLLKKGELFAHINGKNDDDRLASSDITLTHQVKPTLYKEYL